MSTHASIPAPRQTSPLRILAGIALVAITVAAILISILAAKAIGTADKLDKVADDASRAVQRLDRNTRNLGPAVQELRRAARSLRDAGQTAGG